MGLLDSVFDTISGGKDSAATNAMGNSVGAWNGIILPKIEDQKIYLEQLVQQGQLTPEQAEAILQNPSELQNISADPRLKDAQLKALTQLQDISDDGMTATDKARMNEIQSQLRTEEQGNRGAIMQNMAQRGMSGSGFDLAAQLSNQQNSANRASDEGLNVKAQAEQRALEALMQTGNLSTQMRSQDFGEKETIGSAQDAINQFNTANKNQVNKENIDRRNAAQVSNLAEKQRVADANTQGKNQQQQYNKELQQQNFNNQATIAGGKSGAYSNQAQLANEQAGQRRQFVGDVVSAGATAAILSDKNQKKDIHSADFDVQDFLDSITGYSYKYKNPKHGEGPQMGVMAQDLEKTPTGKQAVVNTSEGKMVDFRKIQGAQLAALANINERLSKIEDEE